MENLKAVLFPPRVIWLVIMFWPLCEVPGASISPPPIFLFISSADPEAGFPVKRIYPSLDVIVNFLACDWSKIAVVVAVAILLSLFPILCRLWPQETHFPLDFPVLKAFLLYAIPLDYVNRKQEVQQQRYPHFGRSLEHTELLKITAVDSPPSFLDSVHMKWGHKVDFPQRRWLCSPPLSHFGSWFYKLRYFEYLRTKGVGELPPRPVTPIPDKKLIKGYQRLSQSLWTSFFHEDRCWLRLRID